MTDRDHTSYREEIGAYLLGALTDLERQAFERHMADCAECRDEIEQLRPAADALPRSVEQVEPPASLKTSLMEIVEREAREAAGGEGEQTRRRRRPGPVLPARAPAAALAAACLRGGRARCSASWPASASPSSAATTARARSWPRSTRAASRRRRGNLQVEGDGEDGAILRVHGMPDLRGGAGLPGLGPARTGLIIPQPTFEVGAERQRRRGGARGPERRAGRARDARAARRGDVPPASSRS